MKQCNTFREWLRASGYSYPKGYNIPFTYLSMLVDPTYWVIVEQTLPLTEATRVCRELGFIEDKA